MSEVTAQQSSIFSNAEAASAIRVKSDLFQAAYNAGDAARLVEGYFADDAHAPSASPPGGQPPVKGRAGLKEMFSGMFEGAPGIRLELLELTAADTVAYEFGRAHLTLPDGTNVNGRYTVCWIRVDGDWQAKTDFFAADGWEN